MLVDEVHCHGENALETSYRGCIIRKIVSKEVVAGGKA